MNGTPTNADDAAFPISFGEGIGGNVGLTKREWFAGQALNGAMADGSLQKSLEDLRAMQKEMKDELPKLKEAYRGDPEDRVRLEEMSAFVALSDDQLGALAVRNTCRSVVAFADEMIAALNGEPV